MRTRSWPYPIMPMSWPDLRERYSELAAAHPQMSYLVRILDSVEQSGCADRIAATTSMHDLVVVDLPIAGPPTEVIVVCAPGSLHPPAEGNVRIQHRSHTGRDDDIERSEEEAVPLFWRFVFEKWDIRPDDR